MATAEAETLDEVNIHSRDEVLALLHSRADALHQAILRQSQSMLEGGFTVRYWRMLLRLIKLGDRINRILHKADMAEKNAQLAVRLKALRQKNLEKTAKTAIQSHAKDSTLEKIEEFRLPEYAHQPPLQGEGVGRPPLPKTGVGNWPPHVLPRHRSAV
jgi:hypothetical protein